MAYDLPTIPDHKIDYFREQLYREISKLFEWEGLPEAIPLDYLERTLIRHGQVMFFHEPESYGYMALKCTTREFNAYNQPIIAVATTPNMDQTTHYRERTIAYSYSQKLDKNTMCVLIQNMEGSQPLHEIVDFYALRLALLFQAFDTNALWQNVPNIFRTSDKDIKLSIEKLFADIFAGKPFIITDQQMLGQEGAVTVDQLSSEFILDKLLDTINEIKAKFYETVGINTAGADKKERLLTDEVNANNQSIQTALAVMLDSRKKACKEINNLYPELQPTVKVRGGEENSTSDNGTTERTET